MAVKSSFSPYAIRKNALGYPEEAAQWKMRTTKPAKLIVDDCYLPDEAMFQDVTGGTHEKFSGVKDPQYVLSLWAGLPLPETEVHRIVEQHMLNSNEFFRKLPFPSLSYDNPKYEPGFDARVQFALSDPESRRRVQFLRVEEGRYLNGEWKMSRLWNGDQTDFGLNLIRPEGQTVRVVLGTY